MELHWTLKETATPPMRAYKDVTSIKINDTTYPVPDNLPANTSLNDFIRNHAHLKGTKFMCLEGGCGACIVMVESTHPVTGIVLQYSVNSCLVPLFGCEGWKVTTIEGVGSKTRGYNEVQTRLAKGNGSQCGYCSVGMVMNMHSLMKSKPELTMKEIENSFGGSLCRCTGYRPILDSFKSFAKDAPSSLVNQFTDIEDILKICPINKNACGKNGKCNGFKGHKEDTLVVELEGSRPDRIYLRDGGTWFHVSEKREIFEILDMCGDSDYMLVGGNTGQGVYRIQNPVNNYINVGNVVELHSMVEAGGTVVVGANTNLSATMEYFYMKASQKPQQFGYLHTLADHIDLIANVPVRNVGTLAGNLYLKNKNKEFPSDIFLILETVRALIVVEDAMSKETTMTAQEFLNYDITKKLISKIIMPSLDSDHYVCRTFKIMPRAQNAHAYVNAGFLFKVDKNDKYRVLEKPNIVFGGISPEFVHASKAEGDIVGKQLLETSTLNTVLQHLKVELKADHVKPDALPEYRQGLACSLFYKFILGLSPESVDESVRSGAEILSRPLSSGRQQIATDKNMWPVSQPIPKIEALAQCSGEAEYVNDVANQPNQVYGALVVSTVGPAENFSLDTSQAMKLEGVVAVLTAKDIPGKNSILYPVAFGGVTDEPIYADKYIPCAGVPLAGVFAVTHALALRAAKLVKVTYSGVKKPQLNVKQIVEAGDKSRIYLATQKQASSVKRDVKHKITGEFWFPTQYHFTMEPQTCYSVPSEDGLDVYPATQAPTQIQDGIAYALNIPRNKVNVSVRRCGGGYGSKLGKSGLAAVTSAMAAHLLQRPVRIVLTIEENMEVIGKRSGCLFKYETGVDDNGVIQYLNLDYYQDDGWNKNDSLAGFTIFHLNSIYDIATWTIKAYGVLTDLPSQTWCRAPGSAEAIGAIETIMEHIAKDLLKDSIEVKMANRRSGDLPFPALVDDLRLSCDYDQRIKDIKSFNKTNRWKKRGISLVPMDYPFGFFGNYHSMVSVFGADGTVAITHGCVEMGQGLNTKVAQVCAYVLGVDVSDIVVKPTLSLTAPNTAPTGGSGGSESAVYATKKACEEIMARLEPFKKANPSASWKEIVQKANAAQVNLNCTYMFSPKDDVKSYNIYGVTVLEVELDVLTGQHLILRVDLLEDVGISLSPEVDIGQIEGAYVMGLGLYTSEELVYDDNTGRILTNRTWNYKIPGAKDIPVDFRVEMRKDAPNPVGVLKSKATGEPPLCMSIGVVIALRRAIESARTDAGLPDQYFHIDLPLTTERVWLYSATSVDSFHL